MDDAISRQVAIDAVTKTSGIRGDALKALYDLPPVKPEPKWIPVKEMLPEKNMACLVSVGKFNLTQMAMYSDLMQTIDHRIFYQGDYGHDNFSDITEYVKAWMPLPEPYEASPTETESEDKE